MIEASDPGPPRSERRRSLAELTDEIVDQVQAGDPVDVHQFARDYPHLDAKIRQLLPVINDLEELARFRSSPPVD